VVRSYRSGSGLDNCSPNIIPCQSLWHLGEKTGCLGFFFHFTLTCEFGQWHPMSRMRNFQPSFNQRCIGMRYVEPQTNRLHCEFPRRGRIARLYVSSSRKQGLLTRSHKCIESAGPCKCSGRTPTTRPRSQCSTASRDTTFKEIQKLQLASQTNQDGYLSFRNGHVSPAENEGRSDATQA
jgi:hypothetical protein